METINSTTVKLYKLYDFNGHKVWYSFDRLNGVLCDVCAVTIPHGCKIVDCEGGPALELPDGSRTDNKIMTALNPNNNSYRAFVVDHTGYKYYFSGIKEL